jgi:hypothetical protein
MGRKEGPPRPTGIFTREATKNTVLAASTRTAFSYLNRLMPDVES